MDNQTLSQEDFNRNREFAKVMLSTGQMSEQNIEAALVDKGMSASAAFGLISDLKTEISAQQVQAKSANSGGTQDMVVGGLFVVGGLIATLANTGYIWWGAIVFGGIQFFRGVAKRARG